MEKTIKTAVVGYGLSGKVFHAPFIDWHPGFQLRTIVSSGTEAGKLYKATHIQQSFQEMLNDQSIELVVLCTPHYLHREQAIMAMQAGKHLVIEKPVAMSSNEMLQIMALAEKTGKMVFPYHNRRWDGDFMTLRHIIAEGLLGEVLDFESRFDRYQPQVTRAEWRYTREDGGGTLFDLGPHLIDQAICLFGKPQSLFCKLYFQRKGSKVNDSFDLKLFYPKTTATLKASVFVKEPGPRFQVHGTLGSFVKSGLDTQENALKKGKKIGHVKFGHDLKANCGTLHSQAFGKSIRSRYPTKPGYYMGFYQDVYDSLSGKKDPEVNASDALLNLQIIEAAIVSHNQKSVIYL